SRLARIQLRCDGRRRRLTEAAFAVALSRYRPRLRRAQATHGLHARALYALRAFGGRPARAPPRDFRVVAAHGASGDRQCGQLYDALRRRPDAVRREGRGPWKRGFEAAFLAPLVGVPRRPRQRLGPSAPSEGAGCDAPGRAPLRARPSLPRGGRARGPALGRAAGVASRGGAGRGARQRGDGAPCGARALRDSVISGAAPRARGACARRGKVFGEEALRLRIGTRRSDDMLADRAAATGVVADRAAAHRDAAERAAPERDAADGEPAEGKCSHREPTERDEADRATAGGEEAPRKAARRDHARRDVAQRDEAVRMPAHLA